jgi:hypothetical protein
MELDTLTLSKQKTQSGTSLITCCMDRNENLYESLSSWELVNELTEIIIVDWSSANAVRDYIIKNDFKIPIKVIRAKNQKQWILSRAFNLGISFASFDKILKIDADVKICSNFLEIYKLNNNEFFQGSWTLAREPNEDHLHGQLFCWLKNFWDINGYHENIKTYGYDDDDVYSRLIENGIKSNLISPTHISHIVTPHSYRTKNQPYFFGKQTTLSDLQNSQRKNKLYCKLNPWSINTKRLNYKINNIAENYYECDLIS